MPTLAINAWRGMLRIGVSVALAAFLAVAGCSSGQQTWEVTYENKGEVRCSIFVIMGDGSNKANVLDVGKCETRTLTSGLGHTMVRSVKVIRGEEEKVITPDVKLVPGKRYVIVVDEDGEVHTSVVDK